MKNKAKLMFIALMIILCVACALVACNDTATSYTVSFDANGGEGTMQSISATENEEKMLTVNAFTKDEYSFAGWALEKNGEVVYSDGAKIKFTSNITLYAVWAKNIETYTIRFFANGGTGTMQPMTLSEGEENNLSANAFIKQNYSFVGWATESEGELVYKDTAKISGIKDLDLYAIWSRNALTADVTIEQKPEESIISINWDNVSEKLYRVELSATHGKDLVSHKLLEKESDISVGTADLEVFWGKYNVNVKLYGDSEGVVSEYNQSINISTNSYNIAFMYATFPVSIFTLQMMDADSLNVNSTSETFVYLSRYRAYDWDNLPSNMKVLPVAKPWDTEVDPYNSTREWIKELYDMNNEAQFTLYFNDLYVNILGHFFIENNIPVKNWNAIMYSDGTATANNITSTFNIDNPTKKYNEMATAWNKYVNREIDSRGKLPYNGGWNLPSYTYVVCNEMENVKWYTGRLRTTENVILKDADFADTVVNGSKSKGRSEFYLNNLLSALTEEEKAEFKTLYSIDESTFAAAKNKKIMMILGTSWGGEGAPLEDYLRITMEIYGDEYVYYYKGHPGYPTDKYVARKEMLDRLVEEGYNLHELDNSVAAEFFLFFFSDIEMIGYPSTTFESGTDANADGVFGKPLSSEYYSEWLETYISKISDIESFNATYGAKGLMLNTAGDYYLVEFQKEMATDKDIAIYDRITKTIKYYKLVGDEYKLL